MCAAVASFISSCLGVFYTTGATPRVVENIYGQAITLFGDGIYANDAFMKVGATKGTDLVVMLVSVLLIVTIAFFSKKRFSVFIRCGLLAIMLYASSCLIFGVSFNRLFPLYLLQFGCAFFAFLLTASDLLRAKSFDSAVYEKRFTGTSVFLIIASCSVLVWLEFIVPAVMFGEPMGIIDVYTTEPTFIIDLAIIFPTVMFCGINLLNKKTVAYQLAPVLLILLTGVGVCVIFQTIVQTSLGIVLNPGQLFGLVISFVILGTISLWLNIKLLRRVT
jgi:hypothetical protein